MAETRSPMPEPKPIEPRLTTRLMMSMPFQGHWTSPLLVATHTKQEWWMCMMDIQSGHSLKGVAPSKLSEKPATLRWWLEWRAPIAEESHV